MSSSELNAKGLQFLSFGQPDLQAAKLYFEQAIQADPNNLEALNNLGYVYGRSQDYPSAEAILKKVLVIAPTRRVALGNLGAVQAKLHETLEATGHCCQYVRQFDSIEQGKTTLIRVFNDPDPFVQAAVKATVENCTR